MDTLLTIVPIFLLIGLGWFGHSRGFFPEEFLGPANRLTYYFAIPALLFRAVSKASLQEELHLGALLATLTASALVYSGVWLFCRLRYVAPVRAGAIVQSSAHGNLGYIGLPFAFYFLGEAGLVKAGLIAGFLMILQNVFSISALQFFSSGGRAGGKLGKLLGNPVILASLSGILFSATGLDLPKVATRSLDMLGGLAAPMALLLIGASLSFSAMRANLPAIMLSVSAKLLVLPLLGLVVYRGIGLPASDYLPGLILLASPTATIAYVMAREMNGDADFVIAAISASTLLSAASYLLWMNLALYWI